MDRRKITDSIVIHCSATPKGRDHTAGDIRRWHRQRGFEDIGYHFVVRLDGSVETGRREDLAGAHCVEQGMNRRSIGICYIGGMSADMKHPEDTRTPAQQHALRTLIEKLMRKYSIPMERVFGHRDFAAKACPCFDVKSIFERLAVLLMVCWLAAGFGSCTRTVYLPVEKKSVERDTFLRTAKVLERETDRDTVMIEIRGDTVREVQTRWRWRASLRHDTIVEVRRDTVRIRETLPPASSAKERVGNSSKLMSAMAIIAILVLILLYGKRRPAA